MAEVMEKQLTSQEALRVIAEAHMRNEIQYPCRMDHGRAEEIDRALDKIVDMYWWGEVV